MKSSHARRGYILYYAGRKNEDVLCSNLTNLSFCLVLFYLLHLLMWRVAGYVLLLQHCFHSLREPVDEVLQIPPSLLTCGGCQQNIGDRYFLKAIDQYWHEDCLSCDLCGCRLGEVGRRLYYKLGRKLCRRDYLRYTVSPAHFFYPSFPSFYQFSFAY